MNGIVGLANQGDVSSFPPRQTSVCSGTRSEAKREERMKERKRERKREKPHIPFFPSFFFLFLPSLALHPLLLPVPHSFFTSSFFLSLSFCSSFVTFLPLHPSFFTWDGDAVQEKGGKKGFLLLSFLSFLSLDPCWDHKQLVCRRPTDDDLTFVSSSATMNVLYGSSFQYGTLPFLPRFLSI